MSDVQFLTSIENEIKYWFASRLSHPAECYKHWFGGDQANKRRPHVLAFSRNVPDYNSFVFDVSLNLNDLLFHQIFKKTNRFVPNYGITTSDSDTIRIWFFDEKGRSLGNRSEGVYDMHSGSALILDQEKFFYDNMRSILTGYKAEMPSQLHLVMLFSSKPM
jgi:hypothetical protein